MTISWVLGGFVASQTCDRAQRVPGTPRQVVAWVDYERHNGVLLLNADRYTVEEEAAITAVLKRGDYTTPQVIAAFVTTGV